jgi:hypothetical protein
MTTGTWLDALKAARAADIKEFEERDENLCMICYAYGNDKRNFVLRCFYNVKELIPEALDLFGLEEGHAWQGSYYLRVCKSCRGSLLVALKSAADQRRPLRTQSKDHDGDIDSYGSEQCIPVRMAGATVMLTEEQYEAYKEKQGKEGT